MPLRGRSPLFKLAVYGNSIKMSLIVGSMQGKSWRRLAENRKGKVAEKNLRIKSQGNEKGRLIWIM